MRNKRKAAMIMTAMVLAATAALSGCGSHVSKEAKEYQTQAMEAFEKGDYAAAVEQAQNALKEAGEEPSDFEKEVRLNLAMSLYASGDTEGALKEYETLISEDDEDFKPYFLRGCMYAKQGNLTEADSDFKEAIVRNGSDYDLYLGIYEALSDAGEQTRAKTFLKRALKVDGDEAEDFLKKGYVYYLLEDYDAARTQLAEAVENDSLDAMLYLGMTEAKAGNTQEAMKSFEEYKTRKKDDPKAVGLLASSMNECGMHEEAIAYFEEAIAGTSEDEELQSLKKGQIAAYEKSGDFETAKKLTEEYLSDWPDDEEVKKEQTFLATR